MSTAVIHNVISFLEKVAPKGALLKSDSRDITKGDVYLAYQGDAAKVNQYIANAIAAGASAILLDDAWAVVAAQIKSAVPVHGVQQLKAVAGDIAHAYYQLPSQSVVCIGVTGTNGKTTVSQWVAQLLQHLSGKPCAVVGTLGAGLLDALHTTGYTTPQAPELHRILSESNQQGAAYAAIEVSSIGVEEGRLNGVQFHTAAFTNLTQDHLDYHGSMQAYANAKRKFFDLPSLQVVVINVDDPLGLSIVDDVLRRNSGVKVTTVSVKHPATVWASDVKTLANGQQTMTVHALQESTSFNLSALGLFNVENVLIAIACVMAQGFSFKDVVQAAGLLQAISGRMQVINAAAVDQPLVIVDYAHTPDGLKKLLLAAQDIQTKRGGKIHLVFGCGGNRDAQKRPLMGAVAAQLADAVTVTNDNPRDEDPLSIARQIVSASPNSKIELDRACAIHQAVLHACPQDIVLIAGKGHEQTQIIAGDVKEFVDAHHALKALQAYSPLTQIHSYETH